MRLKSNHWFAVGCLVLGALALWQVNPRPILGVIFLQDAPGAVDFPVLRGTSTFVGKGGNLTLSTPPGLAVGDLLVAICETAGETVTIPTDWVAVSCSPISVGTGCPTGLGCSELTIFTNEWAAGENLTVDDAGDHLICGTVGFNVGTFDTADHIDGCTNSTNDPATNSVIIDGATTTNDFVRVLSIASAGLPDVNNSAQFQNEVNADLTELTEIKDQCRNTANGGCLWVVDGKREIAKALVDTTGQQSQVATRTGIMLGINAAP